MQKASTNFMQKASTMRQALQAPSKPKICQNIKEMSKGRDKRRLPHLPHRGTRETSQLNLSRAGHTSGRELRGLFLALELSGVSFLLLEAVKDH